ncbi:unnamed protein product, partial [Didymodactylos carnosus]
MKIITTGTLCDRRKGKSGRPIHRSFSNKQEIDHAITVCENLQIGQHLKDAAEKLKCAKRTLKKHLKNKVTWKKPPKKEKNHNNFVSVKRIKFARALLNRRGQLKNSFQNITFLDEVEDITKISDPSDSPGDEYVMDIDAEELNFDEKILLTDIGDLAEMCKLKCGTKYLST